MLSRYRKLFLPTPRPSICSTARTSAGCGRSLSLMLLGHYLGFRDFEGLVAPRANGTSPCRSGTADATCGLFLRQLLVEHVVEQVVFMPKIPLQQRSSRRATVAEPQMVEELIGVVQSQHSRRLKEVNTTLQGCGQDFREDL